MIEADTEEAAAVGATEEDEMTLAVEEAAGEAMEAVAVAEGAWVRLEVAAGMRRHSVSPNDAARHPKALCLSPSASDRERRGTYRHLATRTSTPKSLE